MTSLPHYEVRETESGEGFYYLLLAANNQVLLTSEVYTRREDAERAVEAAKRAAAEAPAE